MDTSSILLGTAAILVLAWLGMVRAVLDRLKSRHSETYRQMGEPRLLLNRSARAGWAMFRFFFTREHKRLGDRVLSRLSDSSLAVFTAYAVLFLFL